MEYLKPLLESGHIRMRDYNIKLASGAENVEVMWGDPPKPNAWKVFFEDGYGARNDRWKVMSPLMEGRIEIVEDGPYFRFSYVVSLLEKKPLFSIPFNKLRGSTLNKALFNNSVWEKIRPYVANGTITLNVPKVASEQPPGKLEAHWGTPAKKNIWKVRRIFNNPSMIEVTSPFMEGAIEVHTNVGSQGYSNGTYYPDESSSAGKVTLFFPCYKSMSYILSSEGYENLIKRHIDRGVIKIKKGSKVASSEIKLQWGDPPKPNLWKVEQIKSSTVSRPSYLITSPLFKRTVDGDRFALRVQIDSWAKEAIVNLYYQYNDRVGMPLGIFQLSEEWFYKVDDLLAHSSTWRRAIKPALARAEQEWSESILTSKVASLRSNWFPDHVTSNPQVKLNWGSPAKPNIWKAWRSDSGDSFFYFIESPLLKDTCIEIHVDQRSAVAEIFFYDDNDGDMGKVRHISLASKGADPFDLDEDVRSEEFWGIVETQLKKHGFLNNVRIASEF
jgi:hypothetical protein